MKGETSRRNFLGTTIAGGVGLGVAGLTEAEAFGRRRGERVMLFLVDTDVPGPPDPTQFIQPDPGLVEYLDMVGGGETYDSMLDAAEKFYRQRFGVDFSVVEADDAGFKFLDGIMLMPIKLNPLVRYTATTMDRFGRIDTTALIRDAGFVALVTSDDVLLFGDYGGEEGKPAINGDVLAFGAYSVPTHRRRPMIIRYRAQEPMRANADGNVTIACELFDSPFGAGLAYGIGKFTTIDGSETHVFVRNVLTFPGQLTTI